MTEIEREWAGVEAAIRASREESGKDILYEGPLRAPGLPEPYELLIDFVEHYREAADLFLRSRLADRDPLVVAYALFALDAIEAPLAGAAAELSGRTEEIHTAFGCFRWSGTLAEYARNLAGQR